MLSTKAMKNTGPWNRLKIGKLCVDALPSSHGAMRGKAAVSV